MKLKSPAGTARKKRKTEQPAGGRAVVKGKEAAAVAEDSPHPTVPCASIPLPKPGCPVAMKKWISEMHRISQIEVPLRDACTLRREPKDTRTASHVVTAEHKRLVRKAGRSVVNIVSTMADESRTTECTGIVVEWNESTKRAKILTSSSTVCDVGDLLDPVPKLLVHLPNKAISEGHLMFVNAHYDIALLEIEADSTLQVASLGSSPNYGQEVFALARDDELSLMARRGTVLWMEPPSFRMYNHYLFLSCKLASCGNGGPVIDHDGNVIGIAISNRPNLAMLAISTILTCIEKWTKFSRVARPMLGMTLRAVELLDVSHHDELDLEHNIDRGFIVDTLRANSAAERLGILEGDVIVSFRGLDCSTLPQLEDCLLSLAWKFLESVDSSCTVDLELEVYDPVKHASRRIILPLGFSDAPDRVYRRTG